MAAVEIQQMCQLKSTYDYSCIYSLLKETEMLRVASHDSEQLIKYASPSS